MSSYLKSLFLNHDDALIELSNTHSSSNESTCHQITELKHTLDNTRVKMLHLVHRLSQLSHLTHKDNFDLPPNLEHVGLNHLGALVYEFIKDIEPELTHKDVNTMLCFYYDQFQLNRAKKQLPPVAIESPLYWFEHIRQLNCLREHHDLNNFLKEINNTTFSKEAVACSNQLLQIENDSGTHWSLFGKLIHFFERKR